MQTILTDIKSESINLDLLFFDFDYKLEDDIEPTSGPMSRQFDENIENNNIGPKAMKKSMQLGQLDKDFNIENYISTYLNNQKFETFSMDLLDEDIVTTKVIKKINTLSYFIATNGKFGLANSVIMNQETYDKYIETNEINLDITNININEKIDNNTIIVYNNTDENSPGFKFIHYTDENDILYAGVVDFGFFPLKQGVKLLINDKRS